jgi:cytochrome d ubiquinol oxidase subunit II
MPSLEVLIAVSIMISLNLYALMGGADYGGGVWDLLASGPRAKAQRELIAEAIAPIWEANHVWLILVIVLLFTAFPQAFASITTALHIPLTLMLFGIVLRGSAFAFRTYGAKAAVGRIFAIASLVTPLLLGVNLGATAAGRLRFDGDFVSVFIRPWLQPFPLSVGFFALALFAFLAAVYLTLETDDPDLREDFRKRALASAVAVDVIAAVVFFLSDSGAPLIRRGLDKLWPLQILTGVLAVIALLALWWRRFHLARISAAAQATLVVWGWGLAQFPYLVAPDLTIYNTAAPPAVLRWLLLGLIIGAFLLFPSLYYLFRVFKGRKQP